VKKLSSKSSYCLFAATFFKIRINPQNDICRFGDAFYCFKIHPQTVFLAFYRLILRHFYDTFCDKNIQIVSQKQNYTIRFLQQVAAKLQYLAQRKDRIFWP
jgi:hypothetical protein